MARRIPGDRFDQLVREATEVFIARGYRLTQMSDIADAIGVAKGTLYGYVESKEALLALCLSTADLAGSVPVPEVLPIATLPPGQLAILVNNALSEANLQPALEQALAQARAEDPKSELREVIGEFYDLLAANCRRIQLLDRCMDHPELSDLWQTMGREQSRLMLARYIEQRVAAGQLRPLPSVPLAARMVIETCATWAVHIRWDRAPEVFDEVEARANAIDFLVRGLVV